MAKTQITTAAEAAACRRWPTRAKRFFAWEINSFGFYIKQVFDCEW